MATLSIDGTSVSVLEARRIRRELAARMRTHSGKVATSRPGSAATKREWEIDAGVYTPANARTLVNVLTATGTRTATGDLIGGSVNALAENIELRYGTRDTHVFVSFTLRESDA